MNEGECPKPIDMLKLFLRSNAIQEYNSGNPNCIVYLFLLFSAYFGLKSESGSAFRFLSQRYRQLKGEARSNEFQQNLQNIFNPQKRIVIR